MFPPGHSGRGLFVAKKITKKKPPKAGARGERIKATVTSTMYDMSRIAGNGYFDSADSKEDRIAARKAINAQRTEDYRNGSYALAGGVVDPVELPQHGRALVVGIRQHHDLRVPD